MRKSGILVFKENLIVERKKKIFWIIILSLSLLILFFASFFFGSGKLNFNEVIDGLFLKEEIYATVIWKIRLPRNIAAILVGFTLGIVGNVLQINLGNDLSSPSTLGVSNAAVLGANIAIIILSGGVVATNNGSSIPNSNPYIVSILAFVFSIGSILFILFLSSFKNFSKISMVLIGIALGSVFTAITTLIQYFAYDTQLASAIYWSFGDLSRTTTEINVILFVLLVISFIIFFVFSNSYNAMMQGDEVAISLGVKVKMIRFISLLLTSLLIAFSVSMFGIIGFVALVAPHIAKRLFGVNAKISLITSGLIGAIMLIFSDSLSRILVTGVSLPVGAITSLIGSPIFLYLLFRRREI